MSDRNILVVYYSVSGNTARVARDLARMLGADIERIQDVDHREGFSGYLRAAVDAVRGVTVDIGVLQRNPSDYALTTIGTPVWAWRMTPAVKTYLRHFQNEFRNVAFFVTSGDTNAEKITPAMEGTGSRSRAYSSASVVGGAWRHRQ